MRCTLLGDSGLRVSELRLGAMTFGTDRGWGADREERRKQFELSANAGGTFIDTANAYTDGTAERFVGELAARPGCVHSPALGSPPVVAAWASTLSAPDGRTHHGRR